MNYDDARQIDPKADKPDAGKWRYTTRNDDRIWAIGYCAEGCPGHDTAEGAYEHQTAYLLDHELHLDGRYSDAQHRCEADVPTGGINISGMLTAPPTGTEKCGKWTEFFGSVGWAPSWSLCDVHRTREVVAALFGTVGQVIHS